MELICNGATKEVVPDTLLIDFLRSLNLNPDTVVVECDGEVVARNDYDTHVLQEGTKLELIRFVGGG